MILTIDAVPVSIPEPLNTITCILCNSIISFLNKNPSMLFKHLQDHHQVHLNHNLILSINLIDSDTIVNVILASSQSKKMSNNLLNSNVGAKACDDPILNVSDILKVENVVDNKIAKIDSSVINSKRKQTLLNKRLKHDMSDIKMESTEDHSSIKTVLSDDIQQLDIDEEKILSKYFTAQNPLKGAPKKINSEELSKNEISLESNSALKQETSADNNKIMSSEDFPNNEMTSGDDLEHFPFAKKKKLSKKKRSLVKEKLKQSPKIQDPEVLRRILKRQKECPYCKNKVSNLKSLSSHVRTHHGPQNFDDSFPKEEYCYQCNQTIEMVDTESLIKHYHTVHVQESHCQFCKKVFLSTISFKIHMKKHHGNENSDKILVCEKCEFSTYNFGEYERHKKVCDCVCGVCDKVFPRKYQQQGHMERRHLNTGPVQTTVCPHCGQSCRTTSITDHIFRYHSDRRFQCPACDYNHPINAYIQRHYKNKHEYTITPCDDCGKEVKHIDTHKAETCSARTDKKRFPCDKCDKTFGYKVGLRRHVKNIHMDIKDNFCLLCDYKTYTSGNLRSHISRVHEGNSVKTACKYCEKDVGTAGMDYHINIYHSHLQQKELNTE